jgi:uncharacterized protein YkwD
MPAKRLVAAWLGLACAFVPPTSSSASASPSAMVDAINHVRSAHGVRPLRYSGSLARSSSSFSRYVLRTDRFAHAGRIIASRRFSRLGEVLALTPGWTIRPRRTVADWLGSPGHRAVLLNASFRYVGAARVRGRYGASKAVVWTVQFGR